MTSHTYDFEPKDFLKLAVWPLVPVAMFAALMHVGSALNLLPRPRPALDVDRTILIHQIEASRARQDADVLLVGDSSCLMDVSARQLGEQLQCRVLNLGTLSYLDLTAYATLVREYLAANPGHPHAVVLLMHAEALRRPAPEAYHTRLFQNLLDGEDITPAGAANARLASALGLDVFRGRVLGRLPPMPLPKAFGQRYGFTFDLDKALTAEGGSCVDTDFQPFKGNAEYRLARPIEPACRAFRAAVPPDVKFLAGITPSPAGFVAASYPQTRDDMLAQWCDWLKADAALKELPATLPDNLFAKTTHLNETGVRAYTEALARALKPLIR